MRKIIEEMIDLKERLYESFVRVEEVPKKEDLVVDSHILSNPILPNIEEMKNYHSIMTKSAKTLISELKAEQLHFLQEALNHPKRMNLLFRAS